MFRPKCLANPVLLAVGLLAMNLTVMPAWSQDKKAPAAAAKAAPTDQPVAVLSITNLDRLLNDTTYLLRACNVPEVGGIVSVMANAYTTGLDRSKPLGLSVTFEGQMPNVTAFVPVEDRQAFFDGLAPIGVEPDDLGDGLYEIAAAGNAMYLLEKDGWLYVAQNEEALKTVKANPASMLGELPNRYDLALKLNVQALPAEIREFVTSQIRDATERGLAEQDQSEEEAKAAQEVAELQLQQLEQNLKDTDQVIIGWAIDSKQQQVYFDSAFQFVEGSALAKQMEANKDVKSNFTTFKLPDAAVHSRASSRIGDAAEKAMLKNNLQSSVRQLEKMIEEKVEDSKVSEALLKFERGMVKVFEKTVDEGVIDGATSVSVADGQLKVLVGIHVADGNAVATQVQELIGAIKGMPEVPAFEFNYATHNGAKLHKTSIPVKSDDPVAKKIFGDALKVHIATGEKIVALSIDASGDASLKAGLDAMQKSKGVSVQLVDGVANVGKLLEYAQSVSPNSVLDLVLQEAKQFVGKDNVRINANYIQRGAVYRLSIEEGALRAAGAAIKAGQSGPGF